MMSICTDAQGCVTAVCPDNLTGGPGWTWMDTGLTPADNLTDANGVALYKVMNGSVEPRTQKEIGEDYVPQEVVSSPSEKWRSDVENALIELAGMIVGGM